MEIYALIGASGTGKSHRASLLAYQHDIGYIFDDGLLIKGNRVLAGRSAKRERTRYGAVKRALLSDPEHARQAREKLAEIRPDRFLILATSRRMSQVIAERLGLHHPDHYITIEEISTPEAIQTALQIREKENRHVVPLPTFAIKKEFPGYLMDPLRSFFGRPNRPERKVVVERSIIRPVYSSLGNFFISESVIANLVAYIAHGLEGIHRALKVEIHQKDNKVTLTVELSLLPGPDLLESLYLAQKIIKDEVEYLTGFYLEQVNLVARRLHMEHDPPPDPPETASIDSAE